MQQDHPRCIKLPRGFWAPCCTQTSHHRCPGPGFQCFRTSWPRLGVKRSSTCRRRIRWKLWRSQRTKMERVRCWGLTMIGFGDRMAFMHVYVASLLFLMSMMPRKKCKKIKKIKISALESCFSDSKKTSHLEKGFGTSINFKTPIEENYFQALTCTWVMPLLW